ncbi:MAG TPA: carboxymuconolactone decarboxylase family protein [Streptosporangiaceae bacterium]|nr:carboxymuconolactone decarboxylase family protein [Streptosporangiaceae bacterium]
MSQRMINASLIVPDALEPLLELTRVIGKVGVPRQTLDLVRLRVSQINGRTYLFPGDFGADGEADKRLLVVADWEGQACFSEAERAALALTEVVTSLSGELDPVPDKVWDEAASHYNETELGALVLQIGLVNLWNRVNLSTREEPTQWR